MKRNRKSVLALLLALCMAMSLLCTSVWAAEEDTSVPDESAAPAEVVEVQEEEEAPGDESAPEEEESAPAAEAEDEAAAEELEAQDDDYPNYLPKSVTVSMDGSKIAMTIKHGTRPVPVKGSELIVIEGKDVTAGGSWVQCKDFNLGNKWSDPSVTYSTASSDEGSWGSLALVSGHTYQFRVCYTYPDGSKGEYVQSNEITYGSAKQDQASIQEKITKYLTVGLDSSEGEDRVYPANYDGIGLSANKTALFYNRPLYQLELDYTGSSTGDNGDTLLNFHAVCASRVPGTSDAEGLEFRMEGIYFINRQGEEQYQPLAGYDTKEDFTVSLNELGYGCNYVRPKMICYGYDDYDGVEQYYEDEPFCFGMHPYNSLSQYSALTTNNAITLKPCTNYSGTLSYDSALPSYKGNVSESGVTIWYRKKGASSWTKKKFKGTGIPKISGLKADTVYEWKAESYLVSKDPYGKSRTLPATSTTKVFTVCTAVGSKPKVKSCKVSGAKVTTHTIAAHWDDVGSKLVWREKQVWYTTDFKVTYTFKNPSKNIKGYTSGGVYAAVKGGKVTFKMSVNTGKSKKKSTKFSTKLQSCTNINGPGYEVTGLSPTLKYSGKIK